MDSMGLTGIQNDGKGAIKETFNWKIILETITKTCPYDIQ